MTSAIARLERMAGVWIGRRIAGAPQASPRARKQARPRSSVHDRAWPWGLVVGDFTGDGRKDLAAANSWAYANSVSVLPGMASNTLGSTITYAATSPNFIAAGDLNGDGHDDLATAGADTLTVLLSRCE